MPLQNTAVNGFVKVYANSWARIFVHWKINLYTFGNVTKVLFSIDFFPNKICRLLLCVFFHDIENTENALAFGSTACIRSLRTPPCSTGCESTPATFPRPAGETLLCWGQHWSLRQEAYLGNFNSWKFNSLDIQILLKGESQCNLLPVDISTFWAIIRGVEKCFSTRPLQLLFSRAGTETRAF